MIRYAIIVLLVWILAACASAPSGIVEPDNIVLQKSTTLDSVKLNVSLTLFDPGLADAGSNNGVFAQFRNAEAHYLPYVLKETLDDSRHWGAVRLLPLEDPTAELNITGTIIESNGVELKLHLRAFDATGRVWLDKVYNDLAIDHAYKGKLNYLIDPFQDGFNQIANDLAAVKAELTQPEAERLLDTAALRYGIALSPESFAGYLTTNDAGLVEVTRLPHREDPMFNRVKRIKEAEYAFADTVDAQYQALYHRMGETYTYWRRYSYELTQGNRDLELSDGRGGARRGSWKAMEEVYKTYRESRMNADALRELTAAFDSEITPTVVRVEDRVFNLSGSLHHQYIEWRSLLREVYEAETGLPVTLE